MNDLDRLITDFSSHLSLDMGPTVERLLAIANRSAISSTDWHALCRKFHVGKGLKYSYAGDGWGQPLDNSLLAPDAQGLATALLLRHSAETTSLGIKLKCLNGALAGMDIYQDQLTNKDGEALRILSDIINRQLEEAET